MIQKTATRVRKTFRFCWRFFRTGVLVLLLITTATLVHLHNVGLPEPLKQRLVSGMERQGWQMEYSRLRLRWMQGIVGEDLHLKREGKQHGPQLFVERVDFRLKWEDLKHFLVTPEALYLRNGRCLWTLDAANDRPEALQLENVQGVLRYTEPDRLDLNALTARFHGLDLRIEGHLTNATQLLNLKWPSRSGAQSTRSTEEVLHQLAQVLNQCEVQRGASLFLSLSGDVLRTNSFQAQLDFKLPGLSSPWLMGTNVALQSRVFPASSDATPFEWRWELEGQDCWTPWVEASQLAFSGRLFQLVRDPHPAAGHFDFKCRQPKSEWASAEEWSMEGDFEQPTNHLDQFWIKLKTESRNLQTEGWKSSKDQVSAHLLTSWNQFTPVQGELQIQVESPTTRFGQAEMLKLSAQFDNPPTNALWTTRVATNGVRSWALRKPFLPTLLSPRLEFELSGTEIHATSASTDISELAVSGHWQNPGLELDRFHADFNHGLLDAALQLNVTNRQVRVTLTNTTDLHLLAPVLGTNAQKWLGQYGWKTPPRAQAQGELVLPAWSHFLSRLSPSTNGLRAPIPWKEESFPSLRVQGTVQAQEGDFRGATFSTATLSFYGSNQVWWLPDIVATRPEGKLELAHYSDESSHDYYFKVKSSIDPHAAEPLFNKGGGDGMQLFRFDRPPWIEGEVRGRWRSPELLSVSARLVVTNMSFREETARSVRVDSLDYTNKVFVARGITLEREEGFATLGEARFSLEDQKLRLTNVLSHVHVQPVCRAIGPKVAEVMQDYGFKSPPRVRLNGVVDTLKARNENDLHFDVDADFFEWKVFHLPQIKTHVDWVKDSLDVLDVTGAFYEGRIEGAAHFDFSRDRGSDFQFHLKADNVSLSPLMRDISTRSNRLEGILDCEITVTNANTRDKFTWNGYGHGNLTNGLIWDIPFFAVISPVLNTFAPGLGNSRARQAVGSLVISNGVIITQDLDIRANAMRLKSSGSVDFDKNVNARMEAELLRDMPAIGFLISKVLWPVTKLFEFKITGTLDQPKTDQLYMVPRILLAPLHPFRTIKDLFQSDPKKADEKKK